MTKPRIVFFGTPDFAATSLRALTKVCEVVGVVTAPDRPAGRGHKLAPSAVKLCAQELGLHVEQPEKLRDTSFLAWLRGLNADLFVVVAFRMLPEAVWSMPPLGTVNLHASYLPELRGAAPIHWAIIRGAQQTGLTVFVLSHDIDTGAILKQIREPISEQDTTGSLYNRLMLKGADMLCDVVLRYHASQLKAIPQEELIAQGIQLSHAPRIYKEHCAINWLASAKDVHNLVRGLYPSPLAYTSLLLYGRETTAPVKILSTRLTDESCDRVKAGTLRTEKNSLLVATADFWLEILELQLPGKKAVSASSFVAGYQPAAGSAFV